MTFICFVIIYLKIDKFKKCSYQIWYTFKKRLPYNEEKGLCSFSKGATEQRNRSTLFS
jgi:hypothetical protein